MKKRFLSVLMALALCMGLTAPAFAYATDVNSVTEEDIKNNFTIMRNGTINELDNRYRASTPVLVDVSGGGDMDEVYCHVFGQGDSWTITNTGSKALDFGGGTDYTISFTTWQYANVPGEGYQWVGGMSTIDAEGRHVHAPDEDTKLANLKAGESITIPASAFAGEGPYEGGSITVLSIDIYYPDCDPNISPNGVSMDYLFHFMGNDALKAELEKGPGETKPTFTDVPGWCAKEAQWAAAQGIAKGTGNNRFTPGRNCTHQEILTFLWRAADRPDPAATAPVTVAADYAGAVNWAYGEGMIDGSFNPKAACTRADAVIYIWKALGEIGADGHGFNDIPDGNEDLSLAVNFAAVCGISNGYDNGDGTFSFRPGKVCSRGEIVTLLYRAYGPGSGLAGNP